MFTYTEFFIRTVSLGVTWPVREDLSLQSWVGAPRRHYYRNTLPFRIRGADVDIRHLDVAWREAFQHHIARRGVSPLGSGSGAICLCLLRSCRLPVGLRASIAHLLVEVLGRGIFNVESSARLKRRIFGLSRGPASLPMPAPSELTCACRPLGGGVRRTRRGGPLRGIVAAEKPWSLWPQWARARLPARQKEARWCQCRHERNAVPGALMTRLMKRTMCCATTTCVRIRGNQAPPRLSE